MWGDLIDKSVINAVFTFENVSALVIAAIVGTLIGRDAKSRGMSGLGWGGSLFSSAS